MSPQGSSITPHTIEQVMAWVTRLYFHFVRVARKVRIQLRQPCGNQHKPITATAHILRILKIQAIASNSRTLTFENGWSEIAIVSQVNVETGEVKV